MRMHFAKTLVLVCSLVVPALPAHAADKASRAAGEAVFHSVGCERCHGADWSGTEKGPDLRGVGKRLKRDEIEHQIRAGGGGMPAYGDVLNDTQIAQLVDFLEAQKKAPKIPKKSAGPAVAPAAKPADSDSQ